jgi:putative effector of murein hydrolase
MALTALLLVLTPLSPSDLKPGGDIIALFIVPATTVLALQVHRQWAKMRENFSAIAAGCLAGSAASVASILALCKLLLPDQSLTASLLPKSVTTAIAIELSVNNGGDTAVTIMAVILTGMITAVVSPLLVRHLGLRDPVLSGIAIGVSGHAIGTAKAIEMGEVQGAMSGIALVGSGIATSILYAAL